MRFSFLTVFAIASVVVAQNFPPNTPQCEIDCLTKAASDAGCSSVEDFACLCPSSSFIGSATTCLTSTCPQGIQGALALQQDKCSASSSASGASSIASASSSASEASSSAASASSAESSAASSSSAATPSATAPATSASSAAPSSVKPTNGTSQAHPSASGSSSSSSAGASESAKPKNGAAGLSTGVGKAVALMSVVAGVVVFA